MQMAATDTESMGGRSVTARIESKLDRIGDDIGHLRGEVVQLRARDGEHERVQQSFMRDAWPRIESTVQRTAENLASLTQNVSDLTRTVQALEGRVDKGEAGIATLHRLQDAVARLETADASVIKDIEILKKTTTKWGGGLVVLVAVASVVLGMLKFKLVQDDERPAAPQAYPYPYPPQAYPYPYPPEPPTAPPSYPPPRRPR
jgi:chromosome segregation ATPase